jgi:hypothetical protein
MSTAMADEIDRKLLPDFVQKSFSFSLGCMLKAVEMAKHPVESVQDITSQVKTLTTPPADAGDKIEQKAQALVSVWVSQSMSIVEECRERGEKLTRESAQ